MKFRSLRILAVLRVQSDRDTMVFSRVVLAKLRQIGSFENRAPCTDCTGSSIGM